MIAVGTDLLIGWAALLAGMTLSFLYSGLETGTYTVNKIRLELRADSGSRVARRLHGLLRDPGKPLLVVLIGNNLANYLASAGMVALVAGEWTAVVVLTPLVLIFCELLPKNLFLRHGETLTYALSWFLKLSAWLFTITGVVAMSRLLVWAVLRIAGRGAEDRNAPLSPGGRIGAILSEGRASGAITDTQTTIARRVVNVSRAKVADVMVPLSKAVLVDRDAGTEAVRALLAAHGHPRLGVYEGDRRNIVGVLNAYDVLLDETGAPPATHVADALSIRAEAGIIASLVAMRTGRRGIAIVTGADGRPAGLVTAKDLVEEIVGELE